MSTAAGWGSPGASWTAADSTLRQGQQAVIGGQVLAVDSLAGQDPVESYSERPDIGSWPGRRALQLLRIGVLDRRHWPHAGHRDTGCDHMCQSEVGELPAGPVQHDVARLDVAMDQPDSVQCGYRERRVTDGGDGFALSYWLVRLCQRPALQVLHRVIEHAIVLPGVIQADDVRRGHGGEGLELTGRAPECIGRRSAREHLNGDEFDIDRESCWLPSQEELPVVTPSERSDQLVVRDCLHRISWSRLIFRR
jgi:hypothetical protein